MGNRVTMDGNTAVHMSPIESTRSVRSTRSLRASTMQSSPTRGHHKAPPTYGAASQSFKRCKAKAVRPACSTERCSPAH